MSVAPDAREFVPAGEDGPLATRFQCALCGLRFTHGGRVCGACPLGAACDLVRCPGCGFQFPRGSPTLERLRRWWRAVIRAEARPAAADVRPG